MSAPAEHGPRRLLRWACAGACLCGVAYGAELLLDVPLRRIDVQAPFQHVSAMQIEAALRARLSGGGFLSVDLQALQRALEALPWIDRARVRRVWPASLQVTVSEEVATARWGESGLLNTRGELFLADARHVPAELPQLSGPRGSEQQVAQLYLDFQARLLPLGLRIAALALDARGAWRIQLSNGVELRLGRDAPQRRMERFVRSAAAIVTARPGEVAYVDLRYSNGFTLGWRSAAENADG